MMMSYIQDDDRDLLLPEDFPGSFAHLEVAVTGILEFTLVYDGDEVGTITFNPGVYVINGGFSSSGSVVISRDMSS